MATNSTIKSKEDATYIVPADALIPLIDNTGTIKKSVNPSQLVAAGASDIVLDKAAAKAKTPALGVTLYITSDDGKGNMWLGVAGAAAGTYVEDGGAYCGTIILPTGGDGSSAWVRDYDELNARFFGVFSNGSTAYTALQTFINYAASTNEKTIRINSGVFDCDQDLYFCYDAVNNSGFPSSTLKSGRLNIIGDGVMTRQDYKLDTFVGTVIRLAAGKRLIFSSNSHRGWNKRVEGLSVIGSGDTLWEDTYAASATHYDGIFVGNSAPTAGNPTMHIAGTWISSYKNIEVIGDKALSTNRIGIGFLYETNRSATYSGGVGGMSEIDNVTSAYFDEANVFGNDYNASYTTITDTHKVANFKNIQGQYATVGSHFKHSMSSILVNGLWAENCDEIGAHFDNSSNNIHVVNHNCGALSDAQTHGGIKVGNETGVAGVDAAVNITLERGRHFCDHACAIYMTDGAVNLVVRKNTVHNAGKYYVGMEGGIGAELTLEDNDYFPATAGSEMSASRRVVTVSAGPTYTDTRYKAFRLDCAPINVAGLDCTGWRRPPELVSIGTLGGNQTLTLPDMSAVDVGLSLAKVTVIKPYASSTITIDVGAGVTLKGNQTFIIPAGATYSGTTIQYTAATRWDVLNDNNSIGISAANTNTPAGATAHSMEAYDEHGTLIGYIPVYAASW